MIKADITGASGFLDGFDNSCPDANAALDKLCRLDESRWRTLPQEFDDALSQKLKSAAAKICKQSEALVVVGVGGSYLGARALLDFIKPAFYNAPHKPAPDILFSGWNASAESLRQTLDMLDGRDFSVNIVSKSGSTLEPSIALRFFRGLLTERYGADGLKNRLYVTTCKNNSPLRAAAEHEHSEIFDIPDGIGGRYSVLTSVGLLPAAVAGCDIDAIMSGALEEAETGLLDACLYASARQALYRRGKKIELLACFEPAFRSTGEWWKQLFGESEGKSGLGIFPAYADYTADLHSLGQYVQEGERTLMETIVTFADSRVKLEIPPSEYDALPASLAGRDLHEINRMASEAVKKAHTDGGVPVIELLSPVMSERSFGALIYFFELSCALSALISGVNPFGQPGVEAYKRNLTAML